MTKRPPARERLAASSSTSGPSRRDRGQPAAPPPKRRRSGWAGRLFGVLMGLVVLGCGFGGAIGWIAYGHLVAGLPDVKGLLDYQPPVMSRVYAGNSQLLAELATERRIFVPYAAIPDIVKRAFVSAEDQHFFEHGGVDPVAILRAAVTDLMRVGSGRRPIGASTITQQVAKNMLLNSNVTLRRKLREMLLAERMERVLSKQRILEIYLNEIYLGLGSYGVAAAAQAYFDTSLDRLTIAQAAFLAALPKAPNNYNPFRFPAAAKARRDWVLDRMVDTGTITAAQATAAKAQPLVPANYHKPEMVQGADYFVDQVRRELVARFGADVTTQGGLVVRTTLDPVLQKAADRALRDGLLRYSQAHEGWRGAVAHLPADPSLRSDWAKRLAAATPPPGMPDDWQLGVVVEETAREARIGVLVPTPQGGTDAPRVLPLRLADCAWARTPPAESGGPLGPVPRQMDAIVQPGDIVMVQRADAEPAHGKTPARGARVLLRQIPKVEGGLVSIDPATGRVLALVGGWSFARSQFNRASQAQRQPGSSFKPFVYLAALERGISPSQKFLDAPFVVDLGAQGKWRPGNYEGDFMGPISLHIALQESRNLVTVRVANRIGMASVARTAEAFGMADKIPLLLPAALGAIDTTVLREAGAYAGIDAGGLKVEPTLIDTVQDRDGHVVWRAPSEPTCDPCDDPKTLPTLTDVRPRIADAQSVYQLNLMMQGVVQRGTGTKAAFGGRQIAGKTGTSQDFQDAWFAGFTPGLVTVVWIGYDTPSSLGNNETGGNVSAPVWRDFMETALKGTPKLTFPVPPDLTVASYPSGYGTVTDAFKPGQTPGGSAPVGELATTAAPGAGGTAGATGAASPPPGAPGASPPGAAAPPAAAAGVDTQMPGLY